MAGVEFLIHGADVGGVKINDTCTAIGVGVFDACSREIVRIELTGEGNKKKAKPNRGEVVVRLIVDRKV